MMRRGEIATLCWKRRVEGREIPQLWYKVESANSHVWQMTRKVNVLTA